MPATLLTLRALTATLLLTTLATAQSPAPPTFEAADIHSSPHLNINMFNGSVLQGDRYIYRQATMLDLIANAYSLDADNVQEGPTWLETDRFDIIAKTSPTASKDQQRLMLQTLLTDRFHLVTHTSEKPMPAYVLTTIKGKSKLTAADDPSAPDNCAFQPPPNPGPNSNIAFLCKNTTMETLAKNLRQWGGAYTPKPVVDATSLKGGFDFRIEWTGKGQLARAGADAITLPDALEKQLGLKLDLQTAPRPVLVVDSVLQHPTPNSPDLEKILPTPPPPTFDVATIRPAQPGAQGNGRISGGQVNVTSVPLRFLIDFAWDLNPNDNDNIANAPKWLDSDKFDILAKASSDTKLSSDPNMSIEQDDLRHMVRDLITTRFQMKSHTEDRPIEAYTLLAINPKLKPADPKSRTHCINGPGPDGKDPRLTNPYLDRLVACQNMTMAQIAIELRDLAPGYIYNPVLDATHLTGSYDFTLSFSSAGQLKAASAAQTSGGDSASDPTGALSLADAVSKELGLKLEKQKRPMPVLVIDHIEEKPTEN